MQSSGKPSESAVPKPLKHINTHSTDSIILKKPHLNPEGVKSLISVSNRQEKVVNNGHI